MFFFVKIKLERKKKIVNQNILIGRALFVKSTKGGSTMKRIRANDEQAAQEEAAQQLAAPSSTSPSKPTNATNTNVDDTVTDNAAVVSGTAEEHEHSTAPNDDNTSSTNDVNVDTRSEVAVPNEASSPPPIASDAVDATPIVSNTANNDDNNNNSSNADDGDNEDDNNNNTPETINTETSLARNNDDDADGDRSGNEEPEVKVDAAAEAAVDALERSDNIIVCLCLFLLMCCVWIGRRLNATEKWCVNVNSLHWVKWNDLHIHMSCKITFLVYFLQKKKKNNINVFFIYIALSRWRDISDELLHKIVKMFVR